MLLGLANSHSSSCKNSRTTKIRHGDLCGLKGGIGPAMTKEALPEHCRYGFPKATEDVWEQTSRSSIASRGLLMSPAPPSRSVWGSTVRLRRILVSLVPQSSRRLPPAPPCQGLEPKIRLCGLRLAAGAPYGEAEAQNQFLHFWMEEVPAVSWILCPWLHVSGCFSPVSRLAG